MQILFLDFDGVLLTEQSHFYWSRKKQKGSKKFCPIAISNLNYICEKLPDLKIVISSTWRVFDPLEYLRNFLTRDDFLFSDRIIDETPKLVNVTRGEEITQFLKKYKEKFMINEPIDWLAIDDHSDIPEENLILTDQKTGLTIDIAYKIIKKFNPDFQEPIFLM